MDQKKIHAKYVIAKGDGEMKPRAVFMLYQRSADN